jgi:hypothetical protein
MTITLGFVEAKGRCELKPTRLCCYSCLPILNCQVQLLSRQDSTRKEGTQVARWWIKPHHPPSSLFFQLSSSILLIIFWRVLIYLLYKSNIVESLTSIQNNIPLHRTITSHHRLSPPLLPSQICVCACIMQSPGPVPKHRAGGDAGHTILQAFLFFFSLTSFITCILTAIAAANYNKTLSTYIRSPGNRMQEDTWRPT